MTCRTPTDPAQDHSEPFPDPVWDLSPTYERAPMPLILLIWIIAPVIGWSFVALMVWLWTLIT